ncbi:hypothetical protein IAT38_004532 [Cryptococcus sp. DSM 104549]
MPSSPTSTEEGAVVKRLEAQLAAEKRKVAALERDVEESKKILGIIMQALDCLSVWATGRGKTTIHQWIETKGDEADKEGVKEVVDICKQIDEAVEPAPLRSAARRSFWSRAAVYAFEIVTFFITLFSTIGFNSLGAVK